MIGGSLGISGTTSVSSSTSPITSASFTVARLSFLDDKWEGSCGFEPAASASLALGLRMGASSTAGTLTTSIGFCS